MGQAADRDIRNIALVLRLAYASGRDILQGVSRYAKSRRRWRFHIVNFTGDATLADLANIPDGRIDGIIANGIDNAALAAHLAARPAPLVVVGARSPGLGHRTANLAFVRNDDAAIGRFGADYLASLGRFRSYGFVDWKSDGYVSVLRRDGFLGRLAKRGISASVYSTGEDLENGSASDADALAAWLAALPKPAAVMAVYDLRAAQVQEAAARARLRIPRDVALIGVDNDELICDACEPPLTSIAPDHERLGELAAGALARLLDGPPRRRTFTLRSTAKRMVERQSARAVVPAATLVERALSFIRRNALRGASPADVAEHLGVSRRLADLRFRQLAGESMLSAILKLRIAEAKRRLETSDAPVAAISAACGFGSENHAKKLFRQRTGMSMSEYRRRARRETPSGLV